MRANGKIVEFLRNAPVDALAQSTEQIPDAENGSSMNELDLHDSNWEDAQMPRLSQFLSGRCESLVWLDLYNNKLTSAALAELSKAFPSLPHLRGLTLSQNDFSLLDHFEYFAYRLALLPALEQLWLTACNLRTEHAVALSQTQALPSLPALRTLRIDRNPLGIGASKIAHSLLPRVQSASRTLLRLQISSEGLTATSAAAIAGLAARAKPPFNLGHVFNPLQLYTRDQVLDLGESEDRAYLGTALHAACMDNDEPAVRWLLERKADSRFAPPGGRSALELARQFSFVCSRTLLEYIAKRDATALEELKVAQSRALVSVPAKAVVCGSAAAGKTTLVLALAERCYDAAVARTAHKNVATDGIDVTLLHPFEASDLRISMWDFGGQHVLYNTHEFFMSQDAVYLLVADAACLVRRGCEYDAQGKEINNLTDEKLDELRDKTRDDFVHWVIKVADINKMSTVLPIIVGTHCDRLTAQERRDAQAILADLAKVNGLDIGKFRYQEMFGGSNKKRVQRHAEDLLKVLADSCQEYMTNLPKDLEITWISLKQRLGRLSRVVATKWLWWSDFTIAAREEGVNSEKIEECVRFLANRGVLLTYRHQSTAAPDLVVLDAEWLAKAFSSVVTIEKRGRSGIFDTHLLETQWGRHKMNYPPEIWEDLLKLFSFFQLVVELPGTPRRWVVPSMIRPKDQNDEKRLSVVWPAQPKDGMVEYGRRVTFKGGVRNPGFLQRLMSRMLHFPGVEILDQMMYDKLFIVQLNSASQLGEGFVRAEFYEKDMINLLVRCQPTDSADKALCLGYFFGMLTQTLASYYEFEKKFAIFNSVKVLFSGTVVADEAEALSTALSGDTKYAEQAPDLHAKGVPIFQMSELEVVKLLGVGGLGEVSLVRHLATGQMMAFKTLKQKNKYREFLDEVQMMSALRGSPHLVALYGLVLQPDMQGMLLELADGNSVMRRNKNKMQMSVDEAIACMGDIANGMQWIHTRSFNFIHSDLRSDNVFLMLNPQDSTRVKGAKVGDFGECVLAMPMAGKTVLLWQVVAPEAFRSCGIVGFTKKMDVYSFGMVSWEMLTGEYPFDKELKEMGISEDVMRKTILTRGVLLDFPPNVPEYIVQLIRACWSLDPEERPSFDQICETLQQKKR